jgi:hypothetical protein
VKLEPEMLLTVPEAPPAAGPERAFDPPPAAPGRPVVPPPDEGCAAVLEEEVARTAESAITAHASAAATIQVIFFDSNRRIARKRACLTTPTGLDPG